MWNVHKLYKKKESPATSFQTKFIPPTSKRKTKKSKPRPNPFFPPTNSSERVPHPGRARNKQGGPHPVRPRLHNHRPGQVAAAPVHHLSRAWPLRRQDRSAGEEGAHVLDGDPLQGADGRGDEAGPGGAPPGEGLLRAPFRSRHFLRDSPFTLYGPEESPIDVHHSKIVLGLRKRQFSRLNLLAKNQTKSGNETKNSHKMIYFLSLIKCTLMPLNVINAPRNAHTHTPKKSNRSTWGTFRRTASGSNIRSIWDSFPSRRASVTN
uniref:(northern house mosquito) hypothetical protein n=1 Tax=Culex pipiens TaxID=7175 RepID=A0A8D8AGU1_CULPI